MIRENTLFLTVSQGILFDTLPETTMNPAGASAAGFCWLGECDSDTLTAIVECILQHTGAGVGKFGIKIDVFSVEIGLGKIDGDYGNATFKAVQAFQTDNGLEVTGIVDTLTYEKLLGWADC